jgi:GTP-binding protein HflX
LNDRPHGGERVVLVHVNFPAGKMEEDLKEFEELAVSAGAIVTAVVTGTRRVPESKYFVGSGKAEEIRDVVLVNQVQLVIFNHVLSPAQERNLERLIKCRVLDRTGLILDIFAQRARSFEGKLQVELALLNHLATRLVRGWTHLERQRGGIGLRGPGETQLEADRRLIRRRIKTINARLAKLRTRREQSRRARKKTTIPIVALVGYTNAGKSTLFNLLTGATAYVADQLFATLDLTFRRADFPKIGPIIFIDTVGFIRHLPHDLIDAFHATLEEVTEADLLLHIVDAHTENRETNIKQVNSVLESIGAQDVPTLLVYNKIDLLSGSEQDYNEQNQTKYVSISASQGRGIGKLINAMTDCLCQDVVTCEVLLSPSQARLRASLYARQAVLSEQIDKEGYYHLSIRLLRVELEKLFR